MWTEHLVLPVGTQVITAIEVREPGGTLLSPRGATGVVVKAPADGTHAYRVRFPDGSEYGYHRDQLRILREYLKEPLLPDALADHDLHQYVIYRCVVGSRAFGLAHEDSDTDRRGVYLPPAARQWSLYGVPEQLEDQDSQECYWELQKFLTLALKANPNILECLYTPLIEYASPLAEELLAMRGSFLSTLVYQTYNGYVLSQFKKLQQDLRNSGSIRWKHAMHLIRLLLSGISILREGEVPVAVGEHREALLAVRRGEWDWEQVEAWRLSLHREFEQAFADSRLPERPDYERVNTYLIHARRTMVE